MHSVYNVEKDIEVWEVWVQKSGEEGKEKGRKNRAGEGEGRKEKKTSCTTKSSFICTVSDNYEINAYIEYFIILHNK